MEKHLSLYHGTTTKFLALARADGFLGTNRYDLSHTGIWVAPSFKKAAFYARNGGDCPPEGSGRKDPLVITLLVPLSHPLAYRGWASRHETLGSLLSNGKIPDWAREIALCEITIDAISNEVPIPVQGC